MAADWCREQTTLAGASYVAVRTADLPDLHMRLLSFSALRDLGTCQLNLALPWSKILSHHFFLMMRARALVPLYTLAMVPCRNLLQGPRPGRLQQCEEPRVVVQICKNIFSCTCKQAEFSQKQSKQQAPAQPSVSWLSLWICLA